MILPTMTPEEKVRQMEKLKPLLTEAVMSWMKRNNKIVFKTKVFPTYYTFERDFEGMGKWMVIVEAESKAVLKKGILSIKGYQTYTVSHSKVESNKRFVDAKGLAQPEFPDLVKMVLREHHNAMDETQTGITIKLLEEDRMFYEENEDFSRQEGYKNLITYSRNGISLGLSSPDRRYFNFTTFVSNEMLKDDQIEKQKSNLHDLSSIRYKQDRDPFAPQIVKKKFADPYLREHIKIKDN